jgi:hypothetical protein
MKIEKGKTVYIGKHVFRDEIPDKFLTEKMRKAFSKIEPKEEKPKKKESK